MARTAVSEEELRVALIALRKEKPTLGVVKIHTLLLEDHPTWAISEKRVRKILQSEGLVATEKESGTSPAIPTYPVSRLNKSLDVTKWSNKVQVHHFDAFKGKGLVATEKISEGEVVWKEDPFILAPEWCVFLSSVTTAQKLQDSHDVSIADHAGKSMTCKSPPRHVRSALPLWGTILHSISPARHPHHPHHAQPCSAIAFVAHNQRKCIRLSALPVIQHRWRS